MCPVIKAITVQLVRMLETPILKYITFIFAVVVGPSVSHSGELISSWNINACMTINRDSKTSINHQL